MLLSIGKSPVNQLPVPGVNDAAWAQLTLYTVVRAVQARGFYFNREDQYPITPDGSGYIQLPQNALDLTPSERSRHYVLRSNGSGSMYLYDLEKHTANIGQFLNGQPLKTDIIWCFPFESCPQPAREYMYRRAGREFQTSAVGSQVLYQYSKEAEVEAFAELQRAESQDGKSNLFAAPNTTNMAVNRQPGAVYRRW
jgi:hypothetical protein